MGKRTCIAALIAVVATVVGYRAGVKPWIYRWGSADDEIGSALPGDDWIAAASAPSTRAITIDAPIEMIWPWLVQIGENRGGFYSYSVLERAVGVDAHNADRIHSEWQDLRTGDTIWLARRYGEAGRTVVAAVKPNSHLVLMSPADFARTRRGEKASGAWSFYLRPCGGGTRLLVRTSGKPCGHAAFDIVHFVMEQKMMRGIRDRARQTRRRQLNESIARDVSDQRTAVLAAASLERRTAIT
jgi:hypothetical protein